MQLRSLKDTAIEIFHEANFKLPKWWSNVTVFLVNKFNFCKTTIGSEIERNINAESVFEKG